MTEDQIEAAVKRALPRGNVAPTGDELFPDRIQSPATNCRVPDTALAVYAAGGAFSTSSFPHVVVTSASKDLLWLNRAATGGILINARVFDDRHDIVARLSDNRFWSNNNSRVQRHGRSVLEVYDHLDDLVLRVHYLNPKAVLISGRFRSANGSMLMIDDKQMCVMPSQNCFTSPCSGSNGGTDISF
jgi:hypothetical protein